MNEKTRNALFSSVTDEWSTPPRIFQGSRCRVQLHARSVRDRRKSQVPGIFHSIRRRPLAELGRTPGLCQPALLQNQAVGRKGVHGRTEKRDARCFIDTSPDRHALLSRFYISQGRGQVYKRTSQVWKSKELGSVPVNARYLQSAGSMSRKVAT